MQKLYDAFNNWQQPLLVICVTKYISTNILWLEKKIDTVNQRCSIELYMSQNEEKFYRNEIDVFINCNCTANWKSQIHSVKKKIFFLKISAIHAK